MWDKLGINLHEGAPGHMDLYTLLLVIPGSHYNLLSPLITSCPQKHPNGLELLHICLAAMAYLQPEHLQGCSGLGA